MPGKITDLVTLAAADPADLLEIVDVSDTTAAPTGTNKKIPAGNLSSTFYGDIRTPWDERTGPGPGNTSYGGLPGRGLIWGQSIGFNNQWATVCPFPVHNGESVTIKSFRLVCDTAAVGGNVCAAVYSASSWAAGQTITKVAGCEAVNVDISTTGNKTLTLGSPVTLSPGRYYMCWLVYWTSGSPTLQAQQLTNRGYFGTDIQQGNNSTYDTFVVTTGITSLPTTLVANSAATGGPFVPVTMAFG